MSYNEYDHQIRLVETPYLKTLSFSFLILLLF